MSEQHTEERYEFLADDPNFSVMPVMVSLIIGAFFAILNETLLNIALTTLMEQFSISAPTVQWMATGFMLVMGIMTPISAVLLQSFTTRKMFIGTMTVFTIGTSICAIAPSFSILLTGRLLQAVGTGLLIPIIFNTFLLLFPPERRGSVMGTVGLVIMFAPAIGPTLSGIIVEHLGWRYLFITVIPFALFSIAFGYKFLKNVGEVTKPKIDVFSILLSTLGFGGIVLGFSLAGEGEAGFLTPKVYLLIITGIVSLIFFTLRQLKLPEPLLDVRVFKYPMFTLAVSLFLIIIMTMFSSEIILPMYMQGPLEIKAATAGLVLLPGALLNGLMSPVMGKLFDRFGPRKLMIPATFTLSIIMFALSRIGMDTPLWYIIVCYLFLMLSISAVMMPAQTNGLNQLPKSLYPHGTAIMNTLQPVAGAMGVAVFIGIMTSRQQAYLSNAANPNNPTTINEGMVAGVELVYLIVFAVVATGFVLTLFVKRATPEDIQTTESEAETSS
ncbi:DHA2 family efflux MFS transporter permease subunit [Pontibacillus yanchengensis]|uniref:DHA2 family efflux MFS transporter permease subunit n=2 Tax=Pontibacillus yanchengensis TaxID=462910 RepID=A0ACC7VGF3_9BACI|nr:MDR family MFS transporter [Pontibacillus yanchengensis]MYL35625.1 DHA2 family efflux MFS transporter permease subunit [Pontibacillus yanchengensis]MYL53685.1 DHA2 family efflux MFS transporter permease subunit [Pontibacillus yanchengensis]